MYLPQSSDMQFDELFFFFLNFPVCECLCSAIDCDAIQVLPEHPATPYCIGSQKMDCLASNESTTSFLIFQFHETVFLYL